MFIKVLWSVLAQQSNIIVDSKDLKSVEMLMCDYECEKAEKFDRKKIFTFRFMQNIFD